MPRDDDPRVATPPGPPAHPDCARCSLGPLDLLEALLSEVAGARLRSRARFQMSIVRRCIESGQGLGLYVRVPAAEREPIEVTYVPEEATACFTHTASA